MPSQLHKPGLDVLDMRLVEALVLARERDAHGPEFLLYEVFLQATKYGVALADVDMRKGAVLILAHQNIDAGPLQLLRFLASESRARGNTSPCPVQFDFSIVRTPSGSPSGRKILRLYGDAIRERNHHGWNLASVGPEHLTGNPALGTSLSVQSISLLLPSFPGPESAAEVPPSENNIPSEHPRARVYKPLLGRLLRPSHGSPELPVDRLWAPID